MKKTTLISLALLGSTLNSCCMMPTWLGGNIRHTYKVAHHNNPEKLDVYTLCATSEVGIKGIIALKKRETGKAIEHFKQAVDDSRASNKEGKADPNTLFNYGIAAEMDGEYETAAKAFDEASDAKPVDAYIQSYNRAKDKRDG